MSKKNHFDDWQYYFDRYWDTKSQTGMVNDHYKLADMDTTVTDYEVEYLLNKKSNRVCKAGMNRRMGILGKKCII